MRGRRTGTVQSKTKLRREKMVGTDSTALREAWRKEAEKRVEQGLLQTDMYNEFFRSRQGNLDYPLPEHPAEDQRPMVDVQEAMEELILPVLEGYMGNPARRTSIRGASQHIVYVSARSSINRTILQPLASCWGAFLLGKLLDEIRLGPVFSDHGGVDLRLSAADLRHW